MRSQPGFIFIAKNRTMKVDPAVKAHNANTKVTVKSKLFCHRYSQQRNNFSKQASVFFACCAKFTLRTALFPVFRVLPQSSHCDKCSSGRFELENVRQEVPGPTGSARNRKEGRQRTSDLCSCVEGDWIMKV